MSSSPFWRYFFALVLVGLLAGEVGRAQVPTGQAIEWGRRTRTQITQSIDERKWLALAGNTRPEAQRENDRGPVANEFQMEHMLLQLRRPSETEKELQQYTEELSDPTSSNFHKWLTAQEMGERFGVAKQDIEAITDWQDTGMSMRK